MTKKQLFAKAYDDWLCLCACVNGQDFEQSKKEIKEWYDIDVMERADDQELYDVNFGVCAFTIHREHDGRAFVDENSIEVYKDIDCLGQFTVEEIATKGGIAY